MKFSPHIWKEYYDTMPPYSICIHCGVQKQLNEIIGVTVFTAANGWIYGNAEPQCRRFKGDDVDVFRPHNSY